jgi:hypothetical protein
MEGTIIALGVMVVLFAAGPFFIKYVLDPYCNWAGRIIDGDDEGR